MLEKIPATLLDEWMAYYSIEPFGDMQGFVQAGIISSVIVNSNPFRSKGSKSASPVDFIPDFSKRFKEEDMDKTEKIVRIMSSLINPNISHRDRRKKRVQAIKKRKKLLEKTNKGKGVKK